MARRLFLRLLSLWHASAGVIAGAGQLEDLCHSTQLFLVSSPLVFSVRMLS